MNTNKLPSILYLDDEKNCLKAFKACFDKFYHVLICENVEYAQEVLKTQHIDLLIADQHMPDMSGLNFFNSIQKDYPHLAKIILTGYSDIGDIVNSINSGIVIRYILKPWNEHELQQGIDMALKIQKQEIENSTLVTSLQNEITKQKDLITVMQKFVPKHIIEGTLTSSNDSKGKVELKKITVLFVDIRGFTTFSSFRTPEEIVSFLNLYFERICKCVIGYNGMIDKFLGDGLLAFFGVFEEADQSELNAVQCARDMLIELNEFNRVECAKLNYEVKIGIGIHTGIVAFANVGSEDRCSYTGMGPTIDLTFEVEKQTHSKKNKILISEATYQAIKDKVKAEKHTLDTEFFSTVPMQEIYQIC